VRRVSERGAGCQRRFTARDDAAQIHRRRGIDAQQAQQQIAFGDERYGFADLGCGWRRAAHLVT